MFAWGLDRGKLVIFEHPSGASSWKEPCIGVLRQDARVQEVVGHQCVHGLKIDKDLYLRKSTRFLMPSWATAVAETLSLRRPNGIPRRGKHVHQPIEGSFRGQGVGRRSKVDTMYVSADSESRSTGRCFERQSVSRLCTRVK